MEIPVSNLRSVNTCLHRRSKSAHECHSADEQMEAFRRKVAALIMERVGERGAPREPPTVNYQLLTLQLVSGTGVIRSESLLTGEFTRELTSHICISSEG